MTEGNDPPPALTVAGDTGDVLSADLLRLRDSGLKAMDGGDYTAAMDAFEQVLRQEPGNHATVALLREAERARDKAREKAGLQLAGQRPIRLPTPPFVYELREKTNARPGNTPVFRPVSETPNKVTDTDAWFQKHGLTWPGLFGIAIGPQAKEAPPAHIPGELGTLRLVNAIEHPDHTVVVFGENFGSARTVAILDDRHALVSLFDFLDWRFAPKGIPEDRQFVDQAVTWAEVQDGVLYISHGHRTYARSSANMNAYVTALDLKTGRLLWRSAPLVANARNFLLWDGYIITGYGFTAEPDFIYALRMDDGKIAAKLPIKSGPSLFVRKGDRLFVRTYNTDYELSVK